MLIVMGSFSLLFVLIFVTARLLFLPEYTNLDDQTFSRQIGRLDELLHSDADALLATARDYAYWDDSYDFVESRDPDFIKSSLELNTFTTNMFNYIRYENLNGELVYDRYIDLDSGSDALPPEELTTFISAMKKDGEITGYVVLGNESYIVSSVPIRDSNVELPSKGNLLFAQHIDNRVMQKISSSLKTELVLEQQPPQIDQLATIVVIDGVTVSKETASDTMTGHIQAPALPEGQAPYVNIKYQRSFYIQGQKSIRQFELLLVITFILINIPIFFTLERFVNRPISRLSESVNQIAKSGGVHLDIPTGESSEIVTLASNIQNMLLQIGKLTEHDKAQSVELSKNVGILQIQNQEMSDTKRAMQNLLEDSRLLEKQIKDERDRIQAIIDSMGEGLLAIDRDGRLTIINPAAEKLLDVRAEDVLGKEWSEIVTTMKGDQESPIEERTFQQTLITGNVIATSLEANHYYRLKNGHTFPVTSITAPLKSGDEIIGAAKVFRDATKEKEQKTIIEQIVQDRTAEINQKNIALQHAQDDISKAAMQIIEEKARLTASIVSLSLGFVLIDTNEQIVIANPALKKILGLTTDIRSFSEIEGILHDVCDLHELHSTCQTTRLPVEKKDVVFGERYLKIFMAPILASAKGSNESIGTVFLVEDITEAKVVERSKDEFLSIASHELRTPLTAIRGNTSMILDIYKEKITDDSMREMLTDTHTASVRLIEIVNDFLNISRLEQERMEFKKESFDISKVINEVVTELKSLNTEGKVELMAESHVENAIVVADEEKTKEVLINLIGNALKFTESGKIEVHCVLDGAFMRICIKDTGRGVAPQYRSLLFRKFQQAGESLLTRDTTKGTGLGLYISNLMTKGMGGKVWLEHSEIGVGSEFCFTLPLKAE